MRYVLTTFMAGLMGLLTGCERDTLHNPAGCAQPTHSVYVNDRFPDHIERYHPDSANVVTFEHYFSDTVSVLVGERLVARQFMQTFTHGMAATVRIRARPGTPITFRTSAGDCARFRLRRGYKYLYVNRRSAGNWSVAYSNYGRGYF